MQRRGEAVGVALAADLAVGDDVQPGALLVADGEQRRVVLGLGEPARVDAPQLARAHARGNVRLQRLAIDEPVGLRIGADEAGGQQSHPSIIAAARAPIIIDGALVLPVVTDGMIDASATRRPSTP